MLLLLLLLHPLGSSGFAPELMSYLHASAGMKGEVFEGTYLELVAQDGEGGALGCHMFSGLFFLSFQWSRRPPCRDGKLVKVPAQYGTCRLATRLSVQT